jgi:hypothetical protein
MTPRQRLSSALARGAPIGRGDETRGTRESDIASRSARCARTGTRASGQRGLDIAWHDFLMPSHGVDDATLRDAPDDRDEVWDYVRTLGPCGEKVAWLRMLGELDQAEAMGWALLADAGGPGCLAEATSRVSVPMSALAPAVRLAHVLHGQGRFRDTDVLFTAVVTSAENLVRLDGGEWADQKRATTTMAFAMQHLGKSRFAMPPAPDPSRSARRSQVALHSTRMRTRQR